MFNIKKCKYCKDNLFFWNKQIRGYHHKCVHTAYNTLIDYYNLITYVPFFKNEKEEQLKPKPISVKQYKELKEDIKELRLFLQKQVLKYAREDNNNQ